MQASGRNDDVPERRLVDHLTRLEQELIEASTRRIHDFERRLELEWEALRQLHEERLRVRSGRHARMRTAVTVVALILFGLLALVSYFQWRLADRVGVIDNAIRETQEQVQRESAAVRREQTRQSAALQATVRSAQRGLDVLAAADVQRFPLYGSRAAPAAAGQALWSRSRGLLLDAARLPQLPSGAVHQVWLVNTRGSIGLGFLAPDAQGRVNATFGTPPELTGNVIAVVVTVEASGGSASPGGRVALASVDPQLH
jgi:hypothetical protein